MSTLLGIQNWYLHESTGTLALARRDKICTYLFPLTGLQDFLGLINNIPTEVIVNEIYNTHESSK